MIVVIGLMGKFLPEAVEKEMQQINDRTNQRGIPKMDKETYQKISNFIPIEKLNVLCPICENRRGCMVPHGNSPVEQVLCRKDMGGESYMGDGSGSLHTGSFELIQNEHFN